MPPQRPRAARHGPAGPTAAGDCPPPAAFLATGELLAAGRGQRSFAVFSAARFRSSACWPAGRVVPAKKQQKTQPLVGKRRRRKRTRGAGILPASRRPGPAAGPAVAGGAACWRPPRTPRRASSARPIALGRSALPPCWAAGGSNSRRAAPGPGLARPLWAPANGRGRPLNPPPPPPVHLDLAERLPACRQPPNGC